MEPCTVLTPCTRLVTNTPAHAFEVVDAVEGRSFTLDSFRRKQGTVVVLVCSHDPHVKHVREHLAELARDDSSMLLGIVAISADDPVTHCMRGCV